MSDNDIKPVAWTSELQLYLVREQGYGTMASDDRHWSIALYDQSAIDTLTNQISELKTMLSIAEFQRKEMQAERDAAMADAGRYRWLRDNCQEAADYYATTGQLYFGTYGYSGIDAAIDAARAEGRA